MKVLFFGFGRMGSALGLAWLHAGLVSEVVAIDPGQPHLEDPRVRVHATLKSTEKNYFDIIVIAVKPEVVSHIIPDLKVLAPSCGLVISIVAGVSLKALVEVLPRGLAVIRAMPNTPATIGAGCTCLFAESQITKSQKAVATHIFEAVGKAIWLASEDMIDAATAISGSGPAYYHLFSEALVDAACGLGFSKEEAAQLVGQTAYGAACQQTTLNEQFATLRAAVTSPGGTTEAAVKILMSGQIKALAKAAVNGAYHRAKELANQ